MMGLDPSAPIPPHPFPKPLIILESENRINQCAWIFRRNAQTSLSPFHQIPGFTFFVNTHNYSNRVLAHRQPSSKVCKPTFPVF
jgi:hypothetical protein